MARFVLEKDERLAVGGIALEKQGYPNHPKARKGTFCESLADPQHDMFGQFTLLCLHGIRILLKNGTDPRSPSLELKIDKGTVMILSKKDDKNDKAVVKRPPNPSRFT
jgi:hypothetical protein